MYCRKSSSGLIFSFLGMPHTTLTTHGALKACSLSAEGKPPTGFLLWRSNPPRNCEDDTSAQYHSLIVGILNSEGV